MMLLLLLMTRLSPLRKLLHQNSHSQRNLSKIRTIRRVIWKVNPGSRHQLNKTLCHLEWAWKVIHQWRNQLQCQWTNRPLHLTLQVTRPNNYSLQLKSKMRLIKKFLKILEIQLRVDSKYLLHLEQSHQKLPGRRKTKVKKLLESQWIRIFN